MRVLADRRARLASALFALVLFTGSAALLSACNTVAGLGEDTSAAGHAITNSAEKVKHGD